jgi:hypothetical protein
MDFRRLGPGALARKLLEKGLRHASRFLGGAADAFGRPASLPTLLSASDKAVLARNRDLRDKHRGHRCFVIGNGPSLRKQDLSPLANDITFVVNSFFWHPVVSEWQPTYYGLIDPVFFDLREPSVVTTHHQIASRIRASTFLVPLYLHGRSKARELVEQGVILDAARTRYVALEDVGTAEHATEIDLTSSIPAVLNVVQLNIAAAIYMGCSPIYLLGLDHDWMATLSEHRHFYENESLRWSLPEAPPNRPAATYKQRLIGHLRLWTNYEILDEIARRKGVEILNATRGGCLDVFPRVAYESLLGSDAVPLPRT